MISSPQTLSSSTPTSATSDLFDQSALAELAHRLVEAAKRAGADAADAVAVRGVAQGVEVRDGRVEESERSEGDDVGLRVFVGRRQAVVSTNDIGGDNVARLAERAVAMARVAPDDKYVGLADPSLLARDFPDLDLLDPVVPSTDELERRAIEAETSALSVKGVTKSGGASASTGIGGMVLVTSSGFHGAYLRSSQGISMTAISGEGTGMERDYDFSTAPHGADLSSAASVGRSAGERAVARANPRKAATCKAPVVFSPRVSGSLIGHLVGAANGAAIARKTSFLKDSLGKQLFDRSIRIIDDPLRRRGLRSQSFDAEGVATRKLAIVDEGVLTSWLLDCATARELGLFTTGHAHRGVSSSPSPGAYNLHLAAGEPTPSELISDIKQGFYVTDLIGSGVNGVTGDYSRGAAGFWIENGEIGYAVSEMTIAGHLFDIFKSMVPANDLEFRYGVNAPTVRVEGLTIADASAARDSALLIDTVREAGALALSMFRTELRSWTKGASSPVSEADIATNDLIERRLRAETPDYGWLSEESADDPTRMQRSSVWIIDPIDGTRGYLAGREDWCVSAALADNGSPVLAAVFAPVTDEMFFSERGMGATCNGRKLDATPGTTIDFARIAGPKPLVERLGLPADGIAIHPRIGSLALRLCRVADGQLDAAFAGGQSHDWDLAAADLIVHEANGRMTALDGDALIYNCADVRHGVLVAAGRDRHAHIVHLCRAGASR